MVRKNTADCLILLFSINFFVDNSAVSRKMVNSAPFFSGVTWRYLLTLGILAIYQKAQNIDFFLNLRNNGDRKSIFIIGRSIKVSYTSFPDVPPAK